jgi:hypothetical protein
MRRFQSLAALLMLFLMMPVPRACAAVSGRGKVERACCKPHSVDACCDGSTKLCKAAQAAIDTTLYPGQSGLRLVLPAVPVQVVRHDRSDSLKLRSVRLPRPAQHSPPGLLIAATIILRV